MLDPIQYLTIRQLSERTGYSVTQLRRLVKSKVLPYLQPAGTGGKLLFKPDAVERAAKAQQAARDSSRLSGKAPDWMSSDS